MSEKDPRAKLDRTLSLPKNLASDVKSVLLDNDLKIILRDFKLQCEHRQSQILPINDIVTQARFLTELIKNSRSELGVLGSGNSNNIKKENSWDFDISLDEQKYLNLYDLYPNGYDTGWEKFQNSEKNDAVSFNTGRKFHLNVTPENALYVSEWLKNNKYCHKLIKGGELETGKIFTVYVGSYKLAKKLSKEMHLGIGTYLSQPVFKHEVEFESGIIGRFDYKYNRGQASGTCGFSLDPDLASLSREQQEIQSLHTLLSTFGEYFYKQ